MHQRVAATNSNNIEAAQQRGARHSADIARKPQELVGVQKRIARGEALRNADAKARGTRRRHDDK